MRRRPRVLLITAVQIIVVGASVTAAVFAALWLARGAGRWFIEIPKRRREARLREGGCGRCGYPLFPVQTCCPECGHVVDAGGRLTPRPPFSTGVTPL